MLEYGEFHIFSDTNPLTEQAIFDGFPAQVGVVVVLAQVAQPYVFHPRMERSGKEVARFLIAQMSVRPRYSLFQKLRIRSA